MTDSTNVFNLGFIVKKDEDPPTVALLSRDVVLQPTAGAEGVDLDLTKWEPVVMEDKTILSWLVNEPDERETMRARQVTQAQATALEDLWKSDPTATIDDGRGTKTRSRNRWRCDTRTRISIRTCSDR